jgi:hypothetical protein
LFNRNKGKKINLIKKCKPQLSASEQCNDYEEAKLPDNEVREGSNFFVMCKGGLKCSGPIGNKKCVGWRNGDIGQPCNYAQDGDSTCRYGLNCHRTKNVCEDYYEENPT